MGLSAETKYLIDVYMSKVGETRDVFAAKHEDYGPCNIADTGLPGIAVRLRDKSARLLNVIDPNHEIQNEPIRDTLIDMANYAIIGLMLLDGEWPECDNG